MSILIPEILYLICSYLDIEDVRRFRLCCRTFADVGACFAFREIVFYLHPHDFDMLRHISLHPTASKYVRSLVYIGHTLELPKKSLDEFLDYYYENRRAEKVMAQVMNEPPPPPLDQRQLFRLYENYETTIDQQIMALSNADDVYCPQEIIPRFPSLQEITMSSDFWFWHGKHKTPFDGCLVSPGDELQPVGCRHLDSLLSAISQTDIKLRRLTAGLLSWCFFHKPAAELRNTLSFCSNLTCLELCIDTGENNRDATIADDLIVGTDVPECRRLLRTGLLRDFIRSLSQLQTLYVVFNWHSEEEGYPARLKDIMEPKHRWEHLRSLTLGNIICERQDMMSMLKRHKSTLKELCLRDIRLKSTSWQLLLPKIRRTMDLDEACICGEIYGLEENPPYPEYWDLSLPDAEDSLRDEINEYLVNGEIKRCPLNYYYNK
ncbi:hypothetical protein K445DRAFT_126063 [Daldinia sp. EC12]|nr:hypothetical protein K445DRAFT_126063 [Daldinia sp. EC12]